jgi:hypothetical protein
MPDGRGQHDDPGRRATTWGLDAVDRIGGVKDECARHCGQRKVEGNVDKNDHEQRPPTVHAPILPRWRQQMSLLGGSDLSRLLLILTATNGRTLRRPRHERDTGLLCPGTLGSLTQSLGDIRHQAR